MKKRMFAIAVMTAMMMSLVACGSNNADNRKATENMSTETVTETVATETEDVADDNADTETVVAEDTVTEDVDSDETVDNDKADSKTADDSKAETKTDSKSDSNKSDSQSNSKTDTNNSKPAENNKTADNNKPAENKTEQTTEKPAETKPAHTHSYSSTVTKQPTCSSEGVKTYKCSCGDSYTESIAKVSHNYEHHDATGHEEKVLVTAAWDEDITEVHTFCNQCGQDFGPGNAGADAAGEHTAMDFWDDCENYSSREVTVKTVHHDAVYTTQWVEDTAAYDKCTKCGKTK